jgi:hypothetical protein
MPELFSIDTLLITLALVSSGVFHGCCLWWSIKSDAHLQGLSEPAQVRNQSSLRASEHEPALGRGRGSLTTSA